jgi:DNA repair protein RadC
MKWSNVSDNDLLNEYVKRFTISAGDHIKSSKEAADHFRACLGISPKQEKFAVCFLNSQNAIIATEVLFEGTLDSSAVYPREVVERVLTLGAGSVIIGHNHPSGNISPSASDRAVTKKLKTALDAIDISLLDHIIVGGKQFFSFSDHHLL